MKNVKLLDCTLRDGGYVNDWKFGYDNIKKIRYNLELASTDIIELGFLRDEKYDIDRSIYNLVEQMRNIICEKNDNVLYSAMVEMANYYPLELLNDRKPNDIDLIRYSFWLRCIDKAYEYANEIVNKGYKLGVQPTRVEQYSEKEFSKMCEKFSKLKPYAIYIVDTFGLLTKDMLVKYAKIADEYVDNDIYIGYHAHNNIKNAFSNALTFIEMNLKHDIILDVSIYGMGRGAGNLNYELIANYLNSTNNNFYGIDRLLEIWDGVISRFFAETPWGYSLEYFITATNCCNPNYASYFIKNHPGDPISVFNKMISLIKGDDKFLYSNLKADEYYNAASQKIK